jgi:hypothetical protein
VPEHTESLRLRAFAAEASWTLPSQGQPGLPLRISLRGENIDIHLVCSRISGLDNLFDPA